MRILGCDQAVTKASRLGLARVSSEHQSCSQESEAKRVWKSYVSIEYIKAFSAAPRVQPRI